MVIKYNLTDFEAIWNMAKHNIYAILMEGMRLDEEGNLKDEFEYDPKWTDTIKNDSRYKYLYIKGCDELRSMSMTDAINLSVDDIKNRFLYDSLPLLRKTMRDGSLTPGDCVSDTVTDDYLDQIICTAWKGDLMVLANSWDREREKENLLNKIHYTEEYNKEYDKDDVHEIDNIPNPFDALSLKELEYLSKHMYILDERKK